jgi:uncharacterized damage-inducible protein DinB
MTIKDVTNKVLTNAKAYTERYLEAMPADGYNFKPTAETRSFAQQMLHLADANYYFISIASGKPSPLGAGLAEQTVSPTKEATIQAVMDSYDFIATALSGTTQDQLSETVSFGDLEIPRLAAFFKAFEHQAHHRGQAVIYLRLKGITPPDGVIF